MTPLMAASASPRRLPKPSSWLGLALFVPLALAIVLSRQASWRPVTIQCESRRPPQHLLVAYAPDGRYVAIASAHRLRLWNVWHSRFDKELAVEAANKIAVAFAPDGKSVLAIYGDEHVSTLIKWDITTGQDQRIPLRVQHKPYEEPWPEGLWPVADGAQPKRLMRTAFRPGETTEHPQLSILLCDAPSGRMLKLLAFKFSAAPRTCVLSADGHLIAFAFNNDAIGTSNQTNNLVYDVQSRQLKAKLPGDVNYAPPLAFSPDGTLLAWGRHSGAVEVWSLPTHRLLRALKSHSSEVDTLAFAPDGKLLASGSQDKTVKLWSVPDGKLSRTLKSHTAGIYSLAFSADGASLASGSADGTVKLWRIR